MNHIQVNLRGLPCHVLEAVCRPDTAISTRSPESIISPFTFPKSKMHLWDPTPNGDLVNLHLSWYRKPRLLLMEKALRLAHRHARQSKKPQFSCFLLGTLAVESDEEGVAITLDRFDPGREQPDGLAKSPTALLPDDVLVPCLFDAQHVSDATVYSAHDLDITFKMLEQSCSNREAMELWKVMSLHVRLSCVENMDRLSFTLHWAGVTLANSLEAVPVRVLPIIPTALARKLSSSTSMAQPVHSHTVRKRGFLTMDQTRKLLLILESDPKVYTLPLVGVWLSGVTHIHNPVVWAWCLRYLFSSSLHDKVMSEDDAFLVVLYSLTHRDPEFYQCKLRGSKDMSFQLLSSTESLSLYKNVEPAEGRLLLFELGTESQNQEAELFKEALSRSALPSAGAASSAVVQNKLSISDHDSGVEDEDLSPRPSPNPHPINHQIRQVQPSVLELSMVLDGSFLDGKVVESHEHTLTHLVQSNPHLRNSSSTTPSCTTPRPPAQSVMAGPPPIRRPLTPALSQPKFSRTQSTIGTQPSMCRKSIPSMGRRSSNGFSVSTSSSSSSTKTGLSPSDSLHEHTQKSAHPKPPPPNQKSKKVSINPDQTPLPPPSQQVMFHSTPACSPACSCCPSHHSHVPIYHGNNTWQGTSSPSVQNHVVCPPESSPHRDCCLSPTRPALSLGCNMSPAQSPVCHAVVPLLYSSSQGSHFPNPCGGALDQTAPMHQAQYCQLHPGPAAVTSPDIGMGLLPADAYRMLMEQDRQLKQLQAQIQKLLDAQNKVSELPQASPEEQQEQAMQTSVFSEPLMKTSVSVAVGTGASLFWSSPDQSSIHEGQSVECRSDANSTGSFRLDSEKVRQSREEPSPDASQHSTSSPQHNTSDVVVSFQSPVLGESASMYSNSQTHDTEESSQNGEIPDQRFYQELLGQVKNRLQDERIEEQMEQDVQSPRPRHSLSPRNSPPNKPVLRRQKAEGSGGDRVFSATLKQLQSLGVNMELSTGKSTRSTVESASTLACINPDAVIPRLTLSEPVGTSIWGLSGGVDLSLEANAIALKYLSDSQLSRLSLGSQSPGARSNPSALLLGKAALENNSTGLSILSSSNMSLATCKYMKKYGLMESGGSSSEEEEDDTGETAQRAQADSALGCSLQLNTSENVEREKQTGLILKNVSDKQPERLLSTRESQSQLIRDLRPKMQLLVNTKISPEKENNPKHVLPQPRPQRRFSLSDNQRLTSLPETQGSVGNFLDLSRLRQLPKLF